MNWKHAVVGAGAMAALMACDNQPRLYVAAMNVEPLFSLASSCYSNNAVPAGVEQTKKFEALRAEFQFTIWNGPDSQYLDLSLLPPAVLELGDAREIDPSFVIEGDGKAFTSDVQTLTQIPGIDVIRRQVINATLEFPLIGSSVNGTVELKSHFNCTGCDAQTMEAEGNKSCEATFEFAGRELDYEREVIGLE